MDIYEEITERIIAELETGIIPWKKPWTGSSDCAIKHLTGKPYSLLNQMLLGEAGEYLSFKQCHDLGGKVKKGAKSKMVVFWKVLHHEKSTDDGQPVRDENGKAVTEAVYYLRYMNVFHIRDCEGILPKWTADNPLRNNSPIEEAQAVLDGYIRKNNIRLVIERSDSAYYSPVSDLIHLPLAEQFDSSEAYYATAFHECIHSTGHSSRLNRFSGSIADAMFGSESYSKEELVAEIGSCASMNRLGIETKKTFRNTAAYIQSWLKALKMDKRLIVSAAGKAQKAVALVFGDGDEEILVQDDEAV